MITGVVVNGVIKPDQPSELHEGDHVRIEKIETPAAKTVGEGDDFFELVAKIRSQIKGPIRFTRDELHERR
jgi:predicted DNA-binding antitoxin AbrB/MazE fold protein